MYRYVILALLLLTSTAAAQDKIIVVLDTSGSMDTTMRSDRDKTRLTVAKEALIDVLSKVPDTTQVGVLTFDGWAYEFGSVDKTKLTAAIQGTSSGGGTPLWEHMKKAADKLLEVRRKNNNVGTYKIVVVTDGEAGDSNLATDHTTWGGDKKIGYLRDIKNRGVIIDAIGLDMDSDHSLKTQVNGSYMSGDDPQSFKEHVKTAVAETKYSDAASGDEEVFKMIAAMPDDFAKAVVTGLSMFQNHPIGESAPPVVVTEIGEVKQDFDAPPVEPEVAEGEGSGFFKTLGIIIVCLFVLFIIFVVVLNRGDRR